MAQALHLHLDLRAVHQPSSKVQNSALLDHFLSRQFRVENLHGSDGLWRFEHSRE